jgi:DnaJ-class molecular chaperone
MAIKKICWKCNGRGKIDAFLPFIKRKCALCRGEGKITITHL